MAWMNPVMQTQMTFRPGDTVIAVPAKSGTTWTMNIFHQLMTGGDPNFDDIYVEVPWLEFKERPDQSQEELFARWEQMQGPRGFKTHSQPGNGPGDFCQFHDDVKYVVVMRNPEEAAVSLYPFFAAHSSKLFELFDCVQMQKDLSKPTFDEFFNEVMLKGFPGMPAEQIPPGGLLTMFYFSFVNGWWPLRNKPNVLLLHFTDMKKDHEGSVRKIAQFLGAQPTAEQWPKILEYTSLKWMKENQVKFELPKLLPFKVLEEGGMVRKGETGKQSEDGFSAEHSRIMNEWAEKMIPDDAAREFLYYGSSAL